MEDAELPGEPFPLPLGTLEPVVRGAVAALGPHDWWVPGLREAAGATLRGVPPERLGSFAEGFLPYRIAPATPAPGMRAIYAVGLALADRHRAALVHLGVGSTADGATHEALNLAALYQPTVIFLVAVDPLGDGAPLAPQLAASPAQLAVGFGLSTHVIDGADAEGVRQAVAHALAVRGPHLIQANLENPS